MRCPLSETSRHAKPTVIFADASLTPILAEIRNEIPSVRQFVMRSEDRRITSPMHEGGGRKAVLTEVREKNLALVITIGEDQPLWHWLPLLKEESGARGETLAALRKLKRRQSDVEAMLAGEGSEALELMPLLDLEPAPRLQQLLNAWCLKDAAYGRTKPGGGDTLLEGTFFYTTLPALHWMRAHRGDCREGISQLKSSALEYRDTKVRAKYIKELDDLLK